MGNEERTREQARHEMLRDAKEFANKMGNNPTERELRKQVEPIFERVEKQRDRNIKSGK
jgi:hypothetical protein